jgi:hypothetical protein
MAVLATTSTGKEFTYKDFDPYQMEEKVPQDPAALIQSIAELNYALGGKDLRGQRRG